MSAEPYPDDNWDHYDPDEIDDDDGCGPKFECAAFWDGDRLFCPIAGTEDCDWECPGV